MRRVSRGFGLFAAPLAKHCATQAPYASFDAKRHEDEMEALYDPLHAVKQNSTVRFSTIVNSIACSDKIDAHDIEATADRTSPASVEKFDFEEHERKMESLYSIRNVRLWQKPASIDPWVKHALDDEHARQFEKNYGRNPQVNEGAGGFRRR